MVEDQRIGVNPYRFGMAGSTDTHNASPGNVAEEQYPGCCANTDATAEGRLATARGFGGKGMIDRNPGGLMGVWAEENSRDALFEAMQQREVFATSGPRISPRFFAGWQLAEDICSGDFAAQGYAGGEPMGGLLAADTDASSPLFAAAVTADSSGQPLQRLQIIKIWHGENQDFHQAVYDIAGNASNGATVDLQSCQPRGSGAAQLCATWRDPEFNPGQRAAYYVRAIENPSCRWSWRQCIAMPEDQRPRRL